ncbi:MAG TPA: M55 family metallopeptidase [Candidatus Ozemobacteraceae bacterium]|nr:M55 family metallopeptidase [Candidatus Ozemobacteraceae bacterium]
MTSVLIIADIEGSTGCHNRQDSQLFNDGWVRACVELSRDIDQIGRQLLNSGVSRVRVKDFHRTGYNLFREIIDEGIEIDQGYQIGPIIGIGEARGFNCLLMTGMHAASGTDGFLPHTLTSKFAGIFVNGEPLTEAELFAASVAPAGLVPTFFSGCETACRQAARAIKHIKTFMVNKPLAETPQSIRENLAHAAVSSLNSFSEKPFTPEGPFNVVVKMRDGEKAAAKLRKTWKFPGESDELHFSSDNIHTLYWQLVRLAYLKPFYEKHLATAINIANMSGRLTQIWARRRAKKLGLL